MLRQRSKRHFLAMCGMLTLLSALQLPADAAEVLVDITGDCDAFGSGLPYSNNPPYYIYAVSEGTAQDRAFGTSWCVTPLFDWIHSYSLPAGATVTSATLQINSYGVQDNDGTAKYNNRLFVDGVEIAGAWDGTNAGVTADISYFDIPVDLVGDGELTIIVDAEGGNFRDCVWFDYSELVIEYVDADAVPSPTGGLCLNGVVEDEDGDGVPDVDDSCPGTAPGIAVDDFGCPAALDADADTVLDDDDLCPDTAPGDPVDGSGCSEAQVDADGDGVCDPGAASHGPSSCDGSDNCPNDSNVGQDDLDDDGVGDVCDDDADGDGDPAGTDCDDLDPTRYAGATEICTDGVDNNCNGQIDEQAAGADCDADGVPNELDNCPLDYNEFQEDLDGDGLGDVCDDDIDGDDVPNDADNCPVNANSDQADLDGDGAGDLCDADADGDGLDDATADLCLGTTTDPIAGVPSKSLGKNRWAEMDGNAQFDTNGNNPTGRMFSVYTTGGCSCAQIIQICGYGQGHSKFGCSNSVMDWWTGLYDREGEAPFQCKDD